MQAVEFYCALVGTVLFIQGVYAFEYIRLSHDGPVVLGGTITFRADLYDENGDRPSGEFMYKWTDDAIQPHNYKSPETSNTTSYWSISYSRENYTVGIYEVQVIVSKHGFIWWNDITSLRTRFYVTEFLNGNVTVEQSNKTLENSYVSSASEANITITMRKGDLDYVMAKATTVSTYWFIDCKYYGQTNDLQFLYNFTKPDISHTIEALVVASYDPPTTTTTTTVMPTTTATIPITTTVAPNVTKYNSNVTIAEVMTTALPPISTTGTIPVTSTMASGTTKSTVNIIAPDVGSISLPYICSNSSIIPPDPNKTYGHFSKKIDVRAPITAVKVEGTNWIQPWDMLSVNVTCNGSGPFIKCLRFHRGTYNVTGNETCDDTSYIDTCNFSILHYFLEPSVYTIAIILKNDISQQIYPLTINIYKVTTKPQLSVIVVPVSCSLAAIVLIIFGVAYYIQSRARFTIEVADFDFGQSNPDMEYKTFTERLRDSFNNAVRPGSNRISVRPPYYGSMNH